LRKQQEKKMAGGNIHLKLEGVEGESVQKGHEKDMEIDSWSWGVSNAANLSGGGSGSGKAQFSAIHISKSYDKSTSVMAKKCATGNHFATASISQRKGGGDQLEFFVITLKEAFIESISLNAGPDGSISEQVSIAYKDIEMSYKPQDGRGGLGGAVKFGYNTPKQEVR
jgi:type VI secretion system secreted protein Hcp